MQVLRRLGSFRGASSFSTWLFRVTANEALMLMRSQRRLRARIVSDIDGAIESRAHDAADADIELAAHEDRSRVESALAELPDDYRDVVIAHYHDELGLEQIALQLHITESAVRSRLHRARARLRTLLEAA
jgi:RNA polymerase sigma-70 factor (ECF subfamily)